MNSANRVHVVQGSERLEKITENGLENFRKLEYHLVLRNDLIIFSIKKIKCEYI